MINLLKTNNEIGINLFNLFIFKIGASRGLMVDTIGITINIFKFTIGLYLGKESKNGKKVKEGFKEQKNNDALA
tara:strand:+ start:2557 stop:2778 length:222 start_codon:yes stop_codon:yes gene_type:complete